jgi:hypothetical protein
MASGPPPQSIRPFPFSQKKLECGNRATRIHGIVVVGLQGIRVAGNQRHPTPGGYTPPHAEARLHYTRG